MNIPIVTKQPVLDFLDAVDTVLNSNTFLFELPLNGSLEKNVWLLKLDTYLRSKDFNDSIFNQDATRKWYNYYTFTENDFVRYSASFLKENFQLEVTAYPKNPTEYLEAMLVDERNIKVPETGLFFSSPYRKGIHKLVAKGLVSSFIEELFEKQDWSLWTIKPNFLYTYEELEPILGDNPKILAYFEETKCASNSASLLLSTARSFLLLTNGIS
jgi:hypothetical protein